MTMKKNELSDKDKLIRYHFENYFQKLKNSLYGSLSETSSQ